MLGATGLYEADCRDLILAKAVQVCQRLMEIIGAQNAQAKGEERQDLSSGEEGAIANVEPNQTQTIRQKAGDSLLSRATAASTALRHVPPFPIANASSPHQHVDQALRGSSELEPAENPPTEYEEHSESEEPLEGGEPIEYDDFLAERLSPWSGSGSPVQRHPKVERGDRGRFREATGAQADEEREDSARWDARGDGTLTATAPFQEQEDGDFEEPEGIDEEGEDCDEEGKDRGEPRSERSEVTLAATGRKKRQVCA